MAEWVKLHAKITESEDFAALQAADPNAALLFLMSLPIAAPWGILPRSAAVLRMCTLLECNVMLWADWERAEVTRHV